MRKVINLVCLLNYISLNPNTYHLQMRFIATFITLANKNTSSKKCTYYYHFNHITIRSNNNEYHFSILGFIAASSNTVMAIYIIQAERLTY